nr:hypothetical protein [Bacteroidales bacterium]
MNFFLRRLMRRIIYHHDLRQYDYVGQAVGAWVGNKGYLKDLPTIEAISSDIGVVRDHLSVYIRLVTGMSVLSWRKTLRIEEAKVLLVKYPLLPVSTV